MTKHLLVSLAACLAFTATYSQDCTHFLYLQQGKTIEVTITDKKGDPNGRQVYQVTAVSTTGGVTTGTITSEIFDKNGNSKGKANSSLICNGGEMRIDMKMLLSPQQSQQFGLSVEANTQNGFLSYPATMKVGDQLPDGNLTLDLSKNGAPSGPGGAAPPGAPPAPGNGGPPPPPGFAKSMSMTVTNRKVEGQESVTTSAGTWNCFRISFKSKVNVKTGPFGIPVSVEGVEWYAPGFGIVKSQTKAGGTAITSIK